LWSGMALPSKDIVPYRKLYRASVYPEVFCGRPKM
jgi:hypothetical protein